MIVYGIFAGLPDKPGVIVVKRWRPPAVSEAEIFHVAFTLQEARESIKRRRIRLSATKHDHESLLECWLVR